MQKSKCMNIKCLIDKNADCYRLLIEKYTGKEYMEN